MYVSCELSRIGGQEKNCEDRTELAVVDPEAHFRASHRP